MAHEGWVNVRADIGQRSIGEKTMTELSVTPYIVVTIGCHSRLYYAFVTSAPSRLDAPATVTLYAATRADVATFAADVAALDADSAPTCARLILVDATEFRWQCARYRDARHVLAPADAGLVGANTLQHWLWQRLRRPMSEDVQT
jgi:hypothetical protein